MTNYDTWPQYDSPCIIEPGEIPAIIPVNEHLIEPEIDLERILIAVIVVTLGFILYLIIINHEFQLHLFRDIVRGRQSGISPC